MNGRKRAVLIRFAKAIAAGAIAAGLSALPGLSDILPRADLALPLLTALLLAADKAVRSRP